MLGTKQHWCGGSIGGYGEEGTYVYLLRIDKGVSDLRWFKLVLDPTPSPSIGAKIDGGREPS